MNEREIAAYLDRALDEVECRRVEAHMAACPECRREVVGAWRVGTGGPHWRWWIGSVAVAAVAVITALFVWSGDVPVSTGPVLRVPPAEVERTYEVEARSPTDGAVVEEGELVFEWSEVAIDATYRLSVVDPTGAAVWSATTGETSIALPADVALRRGVAYYWYVDALLPDGRTETTGIRTFEVVDAE